MDEDRTTAPSGEPYDWYCRGLQLLQQKSPAAAAALLEHAARADPTSRSVREALARALYGCGRFDEAREAFSAIVDASPTDDYAHFGMGLAASRLGDFAAAAEHLALAVAMRPDNPHYATALRHARAARRHP